MDGRSHNRMDNSTELTVTTDGERHASLTERQLTRNSRRCEDGLMKSVSLICTSLKYWAVLKSACCDLLISCPVKLTLCQSRMNVLSSPLSSLGLSVVARKEEGSKQEFSKASVWVKVCECPCQLCAMSPEMG